MKNKYCKIVAITDRGGLVSCVAYWAGKVVYKPGEFVSSQVGPLFIFKDEKSARNFMTDSLHSPCTIEIDAEPPYYQLWECDAKRVRRVCWMLEPSYLDYQHYLVDFWKNGSASKSFKHVRKEVPPGTLAADSVRLTTRIL